MSIRVMNLVWTRSAHKGSDLLTLLAIADCAHDDGIAFPSVEHLAGKTRLSLRGVKYALKRLLDSDELDRLERGGARGDRGRASTYQVNVQTLHASHSQPNVQASATESANGDSEGANGGNALHKEPSLEPSEEPSERDQEVARLCQLMADRVNERTERRKPYRVTATWLTEMRRLMEVDGREPGEIERAIEWVHRHPFWAGNVLSIPKLRKQYDTLRLQATREKAGTNGGTRRRSVGRSSHDLRVEAAKRRAEGR